MNRKQILIGVGIYLVVATISYFAFSAFKKPTTVVKPPAPDVSGNLAFDESLPKTEPCPLTGQLFSKQRREWWEKHRPMGIMIENSTDSRPQSGISSADIVYEAVAEGGITRFMAIFHCQDGDVVGPVRSARTYFIDFISEYGDKPLYVHVGGANAPGPANALGQLSDYGWTGRNDINQFSVGFPTFWRDYERMGHQVATEHTMYSTTEKIWKVAEERKLTNVDDEGLSWDKTFVPWSLKDDAKESERGAASPHVTFWKGYSDFDASWNYDKVANVYKRDSGGQPHKDKDNDRQIAVKNVVVLFMVERALNDEEKHLLYTTKGRGRALIFVDGNVIDGSWEKKDRLSRMVLLDKSGKPVKLNRGQMWIEVVPSGNDVTY